MASLESPLCIKDVSDAILKSPPKSPNVKKLVISYIKAHLMKVNVLEHDDMLQIFNEVSKKSIADNYMSEIEQNCCWQYNEYQQYA